MICNKKILATLLISTGLFNSENAQIYVAKLDLIKIESLIKILKKMWDRPYL